MSPFRLACVRPLSLFRSPPAHQCVRSMSKHGLRGRLPDCRPDSQQETKSTCLTLPNKDIEPLLIQYWSSVAIVGSMLVQRLRRLPNIEPTMAQCLVFAGFLYRFPQVLIRFHVKIGLPPDYCVCCSIPPRNTRTEVRHSTVQC